MCFSAADIMVKNDLLSVIYALLCVIQSHDTTAWPLFLKTLFTGGERGKFSTYSQPEK